MEKLPLAEDPTAETRKKDHIDLAFKSRVESGALDPRFDYEPMLAAHPRPGSLVPFSFLGKTFRAPIWVSSMTGGTEKAGNINRNLARACGEFGLGMGLGSCRQLLYNREHLPDFDVRGEMGPDAVLTANLGVAQIEKLIDDGETERIPELLDLLKADGLIVHVNPLQEAMQPEGDVFRRPPIETVRHLLDVFDFPIVVKEVGQGFGPASMRALLELPLAAVEFAAAGGTNFAKLELLRGEENKRELFEAFAHTGHDAAEMTRHLIRLHAELGERCLVNQVIISGGIRNLLDGYYLLEKAPFKAVFGQASGFLKHASGDYQTLRRYVEDTIRGLELAYAYLRVKA